MPLKLLIIHPALAPYRIDLFNVLARRYRMRILFLNADVPYQSYDQRTLQKALRAECALLTSGFRIAGRDVRFGLSSEISSFRPDVIVTHEFSFTTMALAARRAVGRCPPLITWTADNPQVIASEHPLRTFARRIVLPWLDGLIVYSRDTAGYYRNAFTRVLPIGLCPNTQSEEAVRDKLTSALLRGQAFAAAHSLYGRKVILYVGRLASVKRVDRLLNAFAVVRRQHPEAFLLLVGDGPQRKALATQISDLGLDEHTVLAGHLEGEALYALFNCGSLFALASEYEPWGAVVNEALVAGIPVVCTDRAGARVLIDDTNGQVVDAGREEMLASALTCWLDKVEPVSPAQFHRLRRSLMIYSFSEAVDGFCSVVDHVAAQRAQ